jgi:hypothetical protein
MKEEVNLRIDYDLLLNKKLRSHQRGGGVFSFHMKFATVLMANWISSSSLCIIFKIPFKLHWHLIAQNSRQSRIWKIFNIYCKHWKYNLLTRQTCIQWYLIKTSPWVDIVEPLGHIILLVDRISQFCKTVFNKLYFQCLQ